MTAPKPVEFRGSSLDDLRAFPLTARREAGHQLDQVQPAIYVLHCFQKKTKMTRKADIDLAARRYRDLMQDLQP